MDFELDLPTLRFLTNLGEAMEALEPAWPEPINVHIGIEHHGELIATWGSEDGSTIWHLKEQK